MLLGHTIINDVEGPGCIDGCTWETFYRDEATSYRFDSPWRVLVHVWRRILRGDR
jgi:hypothetical protein